MGELDDAQYLDMLVNQYLHEGILQTDGSRKTYSSETVWAFLERVEGWSQERILAASVDFLSRSSREMAILTRRHLHN